VNDLLEARGVSVTFRARGSGLRRARVQAVRGVDLTITPGETLGLVGESGSGKSTLARALMRIVRVESGTIRFAGRDLHKLTGRELRAVRREIQMVFQDPYSSLDPMITVGASVAEPLANYRDLTRRALDGEVARLLETVGLSPDLRHRYPQEFSGGQRQRLAIARAIALEPKLVICDEAVSSLDVSTQNQVIQLLIDLRNRLGTAYLFVTHDLSVASHFADRIAVMHLGEIVETGPTARVLGAPEHPYTRALVSAVPLPNPVAQRKRSRIVLRGELPDPASPPPGCAFHTRCPVAIARCSIDAPPAVDVPGGGSVACHLFTPSGKGESNDTRI
jgi:oligopeptide/dipeptide ABC transporter ATP-binding protein